MSLDGQYDAITAEAMLSFANYLRSNPSGLRDSPGELASRFGLPESVVRESLSVATANKPKVSKPESQSGWTLFKSACIRCGSFLSKQIFWVGVILPSVATMTGRFVGPRIPTSFQIPLAVAGVILIFLVLISLSFSRGQTRIALMLSVIVAFSVMTTQLTIASFTETEHHMLALIAGGLISVLLISVVNMLLFTPAAIAGAAYRLRKEQAEEERQDRLQLLQRIFDLQSRMSSPYKPAKARTKLQQWQEAWRSKWLVVSISSGAICGLVVLLAASMVSEQVGQLPTVGQLIFALASLMLNVILYPLAGFVAGNWWRGLLAGAIVYASSYIVAFVHPSQRHGFEGIGDVIVCCVALLISGLAGIGAMVEQRADHKNRVAADDQAAMLLEIVRLQQLLQTETSEVSVVVVDCVQSTRMKQDADPLAIEVSFGEFHKFVSDIVRGHKGTVYSVAGDGVIAEFESPQFAYAAARRIQSKIGEFNTKFNRLSIPFRVRIGIHSGHVHADLEQVKYSSVIDIAAHIEKKAPAGGIVVTDAVRSQLPEEQFAQLAEPADGHVIHISLNPSD